MTEPDHFQVANRALSDMQRQRGNAPQTDLQVALGEILFAVVKELARLGSLLEQPRTKRLFRKDK